MAGEYTEGRDSAGAVAAVTPLDADGCAVIRARLANGYTITDMHVHRLLATIDALKADLAKAIEKGWANGGTLVSFCSYCDTWREEYDGNKPHSPDCLVTRHAALLPKDES